MIDPITIFRQAASQYPTYHKPGGHIRPVCIFIVHMFTAAKPGVIATHFRVSIKTVYNDIKRLSGYYETKDPFTMHLYSSLLELFIKANRTFINLSNTNK